MGAVTGGGVGAGVGTTLAETSWTNLDQNPESSLNRSSLLPVSSFLLTSFFCAFLPRRRAASVWLAHAAKNSKASDCLATILLLLIDSIISKSNQFVSLVAGGSRRNGVEVSLRI